MSKRKRGRDDKEDEPAGTRFHRDMLVADAVDSDPRVQGVLLEYGLPCSECIVAFHESLAEGCGPLGLEVDEVVSRLNALSSVRASGQPVGPEDSSGGAASG
ncbi:MAG: hypothetical protein CMJ83_01540 [Planctomycetes bacterium]|jgi:hybrid cluster-associated redox disulfide protein|nr:hypothetical protein [Planctomycetota bacterium]